MKMLIAVFALFGSLCLMAAPAHATISTMTVQVALKAGMTPTRTNSGLLTTTTYKFRNDGKVFLMFQKTGAGACTVTVTTPGTQNGLAIADQTITVGASTGDIIAGPFSPRTFNDVSGDVIFSISDTVGLSMAALRL